MLSIVAANAQGCTPLSTFPFTEDFTSYNDAFWSYSTSGGSLYMIQTAPASSGTSLMFPMASGTFSMIVLPRIADKINFNSLSFNFGYLYILNHIHSPITLYLYLILKHIENQQLNVIIYGLYKR